MEIQDLMLVHPLPPSSLPPSSLPPSLPHSPPTGMLLQWNKPKTQEEVSVPLSFFPLHSPSLYLYLSPSGAIPTGEMYSQPVLHGHTGDMPPGPQMMGGGDMQVLPPPMVQQQPGGYPPSHPPILHQGMMPQPHGELHPPVSVLASFPLVTVDSPAAGSR